MTENPKRFEKAVLLSLRAEHVPAVLNGTKKAEYRKSFPQSFEGKVFVYECGPKSRHKVVGIFETRGCARMHPDLMASASQRERVLDACEIAGMPQAEFDELLEMSPDEPAVTIVPVLNPRHTVPLTLDQFTDVFQARPECRKAPLSWKETTVLAEAEPGDEETEKETTRTQGGKE